MNGRELRIVPPSYPREASNRRDEGAERPPRPAPRRPSLFETAAAIAAEAILLAAVATALICLAWEILAP
jgi:hypothetical protein